MDFAANHAPFKTLNPWPVRLVPERFLEVGGVRWLVEGEKRKITSEVERGRRGDEPQLAHWYELRSVQLH